MPPTCPPTASAAIARLRFPLMLGVVLIHSVLMEPQEAAAQGLDAVAFVVGLLSRSLPLPCVPLYFFIAGYLFFVKCGQHFTRADYGQRLRKRVRSLLVPYLFWNAAVLLFFALLHRFLPAVVNPDFNNVARFTPGQLVRSFWDFPGGQPVCYQFWFLRDLMVGVVLSPVVCLLARYGRWPLTLALCALWAWRTDLFPYQAMLTFFTAGATFAVGRTDFVAFARRCVPVAAPLFLALVVANAVGSISGGVKMAYWC